MLFHPVGFAFPRILVIGNTANDGEQDGGLPLPVGGVTLPEVFKPV